MNNTKEKNIKLETSLPITHTKNNFCMGNKKKNERKKFLNYLMVYLDIHPLFFILIEIIKLEIFLLFTYLAYLILFIIV